MIIIVLFYFFIVLFAVKASKEKSDFWLMLSFVLIFLFLALRFDFGNDYMSYLYMFADIEYLDFDSNVEFGWQLLNLLFKPLGFFPMVIALAAFNCFIYYRFIIRYVQAPYYWLAVFLYVVNPSFMLVHSSAMRQSVAIAIFIYSIDYLFKKDIFRYTISILIASSFHQSALILLPLYFIFVFDWRITDIKLVILFFFFSFFLFSSQIISPYLISFVNFYFQKYSIYEGGILLDSGIGLLFSIAIFILILYYTKFQDRESMLFFKIIIISYFFLPLGFIVSLISRVKMYLEPSLIAVFPIIASTIHDNYTRNLLLIVYLLFILYLFYNFIALDISNISFAEYKTIINAPQKYW